MVSNTILQLRETGVLGEMAGSRLGHKICNMYMDGVPRRAIKEGSAQTDNTSSPLPKLKHLSSKI